MTPGKFYCTKIERAMNAPLYSCKVAGAWNNHGVVAFPPRIELIPAWLKGGKGKKVFFLKISEFRDRELFPRACARLAEIGEGPFPFRRARELAREVLMLDWLELRGEC